MKYDPDDFEEHCMEATSGPVPTVQAHGVPSIQELEEAWIAAGDGDVYSGLESIRKLLLSKATPSQGQAHGVPSVEDCLPYALALQAISEAILKEKGIKRTEKAEGLWKSIQGHEAGLYSAYFHQVIKNHILANATMEQLDGANPTTRWSIEPHGPEGQFALYEGRSTQFHGRRLCNLSDFDANREATLKAILGNHATPSPFAQDVREAVEAITDLLETIGTTPADPSLRGLTNDVIPDRTIILQRNEQFVIMGQIRRLREVLAALSGKVL